MNTPAEAIITVVESGNGPYAQFVTAGHHVLGDDEPESVGSHDTGPSPYEYVLAGLGACTAMTLRMYAARSGPAFSKQFMISMAVMAIIILGITIWVVRRVTAPLASLAVAAKDFLSFYSMP